MFILVRNFVHLVHSAHHSMNTDVFAQKTKIADLVQIAPEDFGKQSIAAIEDCINEKYSNRVVQKVGLFISLWDVQWTSEGLIGHGTGLVNVNGKKSSHRPSPRQVRCTF